jgi:hypothetical protein
MTSMPLTTTTTPAEPSPFGIKTVLGILSDAREQREHTARRLTNLADADLQKQIIDAITAVQNLAAQLPGRPS